MELERTVFIVDDDPATRESLKSLLEIMGLAGESYESAESMLAEYEGQVGCALVGQHLPGLNGLELMEQLATRRAPLGIVVIGAHGDVPAAVQAMKQGAVDFLEKHCPLETLRECILRALEAGVALAAALGLTPSFAPLQSLTASERAVLDLTVAGMPNKTIASKLGMSLRTVHIRRASLMRKLSATNRAELIRMIVQQEAGKLPGSNGHYRSLSAMAE